MNIEKAIVDVFKNKLFNALCKRYGGSDSDDLKSEVMVIICEMPMEKKIRIVDGGYLLPYCLQILRFQGVGYKNNKFRRDFAKHGSIEVFGMNGIVKNNISGKEDQFIVPIENIQDKCIGENEYDILKDQTETKIIERINNDSLDQSNQFFYHSRLLIETTKHKNIKKTAQAIGIPYKSVRNNLKDYIRNLVEWSKAQQ